MDFAGWTTVEWPRVDPRWLAVCDEAVDPAPGLTDPATVHAWARANLKWRADMDDDWSPPRDTLARLSGDCEDWCILERALLIAGGWPGADIWMVVARDLVTRGDHAMLVAGSLLLDCRCDTVIEAAGATDYFPKRAFNGYRGFTFGRAA